MKSGTIPGSQRVNDTGFSEESPSTLPSRSEAEPTLVQADNGREDGRPDSAKTVEIPLNMPRNPPTQPVTRDIPMPAALDDRLAAATLLGGLKSLPPEFGDSDGDWVTVRSENPFTVLFLDHRRAQAITPDMVSRHRELLQRFWQEKLRSMSQGAARVAIVKKYGGQHEAERLVRSYPDLIERAYERISTLGGIDDAYRQLLADKQGAVLAKLDEKLNDFLVDSVLQPEEMQALLELGDREGLPRQIVAERVRDRIRREGLVPDGSPSGSTLEKQLISIAWTHPSRKAAPAVIPQVVAQPRKSLLLPLLLFSIAVVVVLLVAAAITSSRMGTTSDRGTAPTTNSVPTQPPLQTASALQPTNAPITNTSEPRRPTSPSPEKERSPRISTQQVEVRPVVSAADRQQVHDKLDEVRRLSESDPSAALDHANSLDAQLGVHPLEYASERAELANVRSAIQIASSRQQLEIEKGKIRQEAEEHAAQERNKEWERRLDQIESFTKQSNYSGAKNLADQLLAEPNLPDSVSTRARRLADDNWAKFQKSMSGTTVNSRTTRAPHGR